MTRIASAGQQPSREGSADWETGASPNGPTPRTLATPRLTKHHDLCACGNRKCKQSPCCFRCSVKSRAEGMVPPALADYARQRFSEGYGPRVIAFEALRDGIIDGVRLDCLINRLVKWRRRAGIPLLRERKGLRGQDRGARAAEARRMASAERERAKEDQVAAALLLRRPDTPCAWCDCTRPGRKCVECGRVAPEVRCG